MSSSKKRIVIVMLFFVALSMLAVWRPASRSFRSMIGTNERSAEASHESSSRTRAVDPSRSDRPWPVGTQRTYAADYAYSLDFPQEEGKGGTMHGRGLLELVALEDGERTILRGALRNASVDVARSKAGEQDAAMAAVRANLERPFAIELDPDLRVERVYFEPDLDVIAQSVLRFFVAGTQFVRPAAYQRADTWSVEEPDTMGIATATYVRTSSERFTKDKRQYREVAMQKIGRGPAPVIESSSTYEVIDRLNVIRRADIDETVTAHFMNIVMASQLQGTLALKSTEQIEATLDPAWLARLRGVELYEPIEQAAQNELDKPLAANVTFDGTLEQIIATKGQDIDVADQLAKLFRQRPGAIDEGMRALRMQRDLPQEARTELVAGFANANTNEGQRALLDVSNDQTMEPGLRNTAILRLGMHDEPNVETMEGLRELATHAEGEDRSAATLMLGSASRGATANEAHPDVAQASVEFLQQKLAGAQTPAEQTLYLEALGNAGAPSNLDTVAEALTSETPSVRSSATSALRFVKDPAAEATMLKMATSDPESAVRREAISSLVYRDFTDTTRDTLNKVLRTEQEQTVRDEALGLLSNYSHDPKVREQLAWTAENDPSEDVRKRAQETLDQTDQETAKVGGTEADPG